MLQAFAGHADFNEDQDRHGDPTMSLGRYVVVLGFGTAVLENWQSEYLQFTLFILDDRLAAPARLAGVQAAAQGAAAGRTRSSGSAGTRERELAALGQGGRPAPRALRELAAAS